MRDNALTSRKHTDNERSDVGDFAEHYTAIWTGEGDHRQPVNVPALVQKYTEATSTMDEPMKQLGVRVTEYDLARLQVLGGILNTPRSSLARDLISMALNEAFQTLPDNLKPGLEELDRVIEDQRGE